MLAAAIEAGASVIVTFNLSDFPEATLRPRGIRALHPDALVRELADRDPAGVLEAMRRHRGKQRRPPISPSEYVQVLQGARLKGAAAFASEHLERI